MTESARPVTDARMTCIECRRPWVSEKERWRLFLTDENPPTLLMYCPHCAEREFDD